MPGIAKLTHDQRELIILRDLEASFPVFAGHLLSWSKVPDGQDPPDFLSAGQKGRFGLELVEWLDGTQMTRAKGRESQRDQLRRVLASKWEQEYKPNHVRGAFLIMRGQRISPADEIPLRREFFAHAREVDRNSFTNSARAGNSYYATEFPGYPLIAKYFNVRYIGGEPHGLCWIHPSGGAEDRTIPWRRSAR